MLLCMRLCPDLPPPLQQQVQQRKQQHAHSAPQHMQRAMHVTTEMMMREPMTMPTMTGHLVGMSWAGREKGGGGGEDYGLAVHLGHARVPRGERITRIGQGILSREKRGHGGALWGYSARWYGVWCVVKS